MLIVSRRDAESILIRLGDDTDPTMTLGELFQDGPIEITIYASGGSRVKMGVQAPKELSIRRKDAVAVSPNA